MSLKVIHGQKAAEVQRTFLESVVLPTATIYTEVVNCHATGCQTQTKLDNNTYSLKKTVTTLVPNKNKSKTVVIPFALQC